MSRGMRQPGSRLKMNRDQQLSSGGIEPPTSLSSNFTQQYSRRLWTKCLQLGGIDNTSKSRQRGDTANNIFVVKVVMAPSCAPSSIAIAMVSNFSSMTDRVAGIEEEGMERH
ncbi:unnamed protein product [Protopolystoma xenopodis]|uniref:Uncharacterized protein n=1 Tax=Protopolystoma xenopodis TaxID=117903 RepID=A0A448WVK9_9PLAT|nr:unnamed protein product [Protopolystoma xenopodis]